MIPLIVSLIAFGFYLLGLAPTISAGDSGELVAAGTTLGIAHPSGYPLYCLIGKFFSFVFPFASYAYRINLVSAFFCAATAGVVYRIFENYIVGQRFGGTGFQPVNRIIEIVLSLSIVFLPVFWTQAIVSEVFALNIFLITILIWIETSPLRGRGEGEGQEKYFLLFSFILGLGLGNHQTIALAGLGLIAPYLIRLIKNKKLLFLCLLFFLLGFSVNFYLLLRAQQHPLVNWSNPSNWQSFLRVITRADYGTFNLHQEIQAKYSWGLILQQFKHFFEYLVFVPFGLFGWLGFLFFGITVIKRAITRTEWLAFLLSGLLFILLSRLPMDAWSKTVITRFYLPAVLIFYLWAGRGIMYIFRIADFGVRKAKLLQSAFGILGLVLPIYLVSYNLSYHNERQNFFIYDYGKNILRTLAKDTILFVEKVQDDAVFSLIYLNLVERRRTDCRFTESEVRVFPVVYGPDYVRLDAAHRFARRREIQEQIVRMQEKPVYFLAISRDDLTQFYLYPQGLLYRAYERPVSLRLPDIFWNIYNLRGIVSGSTQIKIPSPLVGEGKPACRSLGAGRGEGKDLDYRTRALIVSYPLQRTEYYWHNGEKKLTEEDCRLAEKLGYDIDWVQNNLGNFYRLIGNLDKARRWLNIAVTQKSNYDIAWYNLGLVYEAEKNWQEALNSYKKAWEINPQDKDILRRLELSALYRAYQLYGENEREQALQIYEFVKKINPHQPLAYYNSSLIYADLGQPQRAEEEMKKYRQLVSPKAKK